MGEIKSIEDIKFWTFIPQGFSVTNGAVVATGWFSFISIKQEAQEKGGHEPQIYTNILTENPITVKLPDFLIKKQIDEICSRDIIEALTTLFKLPFNEIPKPPTDTKSNIRPSKRK